MFAGEVRSLPHTRGSTDVCGRGKEPTPTRGSTQVNWVLSFADKHSTTLEKNTLAYFGAEFITAAKGFPVERQIELN